MNKCRSKVLKTLLTISDSTFSAEKERHFFKLFLFCTFRLCENQLIIDILINFILLSFEIGLNQNYLAFFFCYI